MPTYKLEAHEESGYKAADGVLGGLNEPTFFQVTVLAVITTLKPLAMPIVSVIS